MLYVTSKAARLQSKMNTQTCCTVFHIDPAVRYSAQEIIPPSTREDKPILNVHSSDYANGLMKHLELLGFAQE